MIFLNLIHFNDTYLHKTIQKMREKVNLCHTAVTSYQVFIIALRRPLLAVSGITALSGFLFFGGAF